MHRHVCYVHRVHDACCACSVCLCGGAMPGADARPSDALVVSRCIGHGRRSFIGRQSFSGSVRRSGSRLSAIVGHRRQYQTHGGSFPYPSASSPFPCGWPSFHLPLPFFRQSSCEAQACPHHGQHRNSLTLRSFYLPLPWPIKHTKFSRVACVVDVALRFCVLSFLVGMRLHRDSNAAVLVGMHLAR